MFSGNFPAPFTVYRSVGVAGERIGIGVIDKSGITADYVNRAHPEYVIVLLLRGRGVYRTCGGESYALSAGSVFQRFRGVPHTTEIDPASSYLECFLELGESVANLLAGYGVADPAKPVLKTAVTAVLAERFSELSDSFRTASDSELLCRIPDVVALAWSCLCGGMQPQDRAGESRRELIAAACEFLGRDFRKTADLAEFCRRRGCGYENFRKLFRAELGISPHRYRIRRRLDAACALLLRPELSITEISERLGYASPYEFSAQFKRYMGCPPSGYRQ